MKHIHQLPSAKLEAMYGKQITIHGKFVQVGEETLWMGNDFNVAAPAGRHRVIVVFDGDTGVLRLFTVSDDNWQKVTTMLTEEWLAANAALIYSWHKDDISPNDPLDLPEVVSFTLTPSRWGATVQSHYGAPEINCKEHGRVYLSTKGKYDLSISDKGGNPVLSMEDVKIKSTSESGGGHGEGHWKSGFGFDLGYGVLIPDAKESNITVYADAKDVSFG